jgi:putative transposase
MPDTFSQIYNQVVFAVKGRDVSIGNEWEERLYQYITGIIRTKGQKLIAIGGTSNHIHIFIGLKPGCCLADLVREIKKSSNEFVKQNNLTRFRFAWQNGYGAFSYGHSQIDSVAKYILNQKEHHKKIAFKQEFLEFLRKFEIEYDEKYLFEFNE